MTIIICLVPIEVLAISIRYLLVSEIQKEKKRIEEIIANVIINVLILRK